MSVEFRKYNLRYKKNEKGQPLIFDEIRKKWLVLTPEEWVRQQWVHYLVYDLKYPPGILQLESGLKVKGLNKRSDLVVYKNQNPVILIECKAPEVKLDEKVFDQALRYNSNYNASIIVLTNGNQHQLFSLKNGTLNKIDSLPDFANLL